MSFGARTLGWLATVINPVDVASLGDLRSGVTASCSVTLQSDGSLSSSGNASSVGPRWHDPVGTGNGNPYYVKFTTQTGDVWNTGGLVSGTVYQLNAARTVGWSQPTVGSRGGTFRIDIYADAGGTVLLASKADISVDATRDL